MLEIRQVLSRKDHKAFVLFPWSLYTDNKNWCPPLIGDELKFINRKYHPFHQTGDSALFLAYRGGSVVGRIMASDDPSYNEKYQSSTGCFGKFECIDDQNVADALFDAACTWIRHKGRQEILGPVDYSVNYSFGLLIDGFDMPQRIKMPYNPPYYEKLLTSWGLEKQKDLFSWWSGDPAGVFKWRKKIDRLEKISTVTIRSFDRRHHARDTKIVRNLFSKLLDHQWATVTMNHGEFKLAEKDMKHVPTELILIAEDGDLPVGLSLTIPDFNEAIRPANGRLTRFGMPVGLFKVLRGMRKIKCARLAYLGVLDDYRFQGIAERMIVKTFEIGRYQFGYTEAEMGWTLEDNLSMVATIEKIAPSKKTYRVYGKRI